MWRGRKTVACMLTIRIWLFSFSAPQRYFGVAIGKYKQGSSSELEKIDFTKLTCAEAVKHIARMSVERGDMC